MNYYIISSSKLSSSSSLNYITENEGLSLYHEATEVFHIYMLFTGREVRIGKNCARGLEYGPRPLAEGRTRDRGHSFSLYGPTKAGE